jgi:hypothetical protein
MAAPAIVRAQGQNGVALVIGNSKYKWEASLPNVQRDARDVAARFEQMGLKTELLQDLDRASLLAILQKFAGGAGGARLAAVYYAGHGVFWEKKTYIVPVDADLGNPRAAATLIPVDAIAEATKAASARLLAFDSCRNNPADGWRQREARGAAQVDAFVSAAAASSQANTLLLFSTAPGSVALDGPAGQNSPFAAAFLRQLAAQSVDLQALAPRMRRDLLLSTECRQMLWDQNTYGSPFAISGRAGNAAALAYDPARVVELPKAYAFAAQAGLSLPLGLVAYRTLAGGPEGMKIGSYRHEMETALGTAFSHKAPAVAIVMSTPDGNSGEMTWSLKNWGNAGGSRWRNISATGGPGKLTWISLDEREHYELAWKDRDSGTFVIHPVTGSFGFKTLPFTRLDA